MCMYQLNATRWFEDSSHFGLRLKSWLGQRNFYGFSRRNRVMKWKMRKAVVDYRSPCWLLKCAKMSATFQVSIIQALWRWDFSKCNSVKIIIIIIIIFAVESPNEEKMISTLSSGQSFWHPLFSMHYAFIHWDLIETSKNRTCLVSIAVNHRFHYVFSKTSWVQIAVNRNLV